MLRGILLILCLSLAAFSLPAQNPAQPRQGDKPFRVILDVDLVQLPVSVTDKDGKIIAGLTQDHFQVFEDKVKQDIALFKHEDVPLSVGLVIDNSGSMRPKRERVHSAALTFVRESNPDDETFVIAFDDAAWLEQDFTGSIGDLVDALDNLNPRLQTAMHDAIYLAVDHVKTGKMDKKALLVISDGEDTASKWGINKVIQHVRETKNVTIYAIGLLEENAGGGGLFGGGNKTQKKAKESLTEIAKVTGGQAFFPKSLDEVEEICRRIARDLRNQYTVGYYPKNKVMDGTWRTVQVQVTPPRNTPKLSIRTNEGYFAPGGPANSSDK